MATYSSSCPPSAPCDPSDSFKQYKPPVAIPETRTTTLPAATAARKSIFYKNVANIVCLFWFNDISVLDQSFEAYKTCHLRSPSQHSTTTNTANTNAAVTPFVIPQFSPLSVPPKHFLNFVYNLLSSTMLSSTYVSLALHYIYLLKKLSKVPLIGNAASEYRVLTVALMLSNKFLDDNTFTNRTWSKLSGLSLNEISLMEIEFLSNLRYNLFISHESWIKWQKFHLRIWLNIHSLSCGTTNKASTSPIPVVISNLPVNNEPMSFHNVSCQNRNDYNHTKNGNNNNNNINSVISPVSMVGSLSTSPVDLSVTTAIPNKTRKRLFEETMAAPSDFNHFIGATTLPHNPPIHSASTNMATLPYSSPSYVPVPFTPVPLSASFTSSTSISTPVFAPASYSNITSPASSKNLKKTYFTDPQVHQSQFNPIYPTGGISPYAPMYPIRTLLSTNDYLTNVPSYFMNATTPSRPISGTSSNPTNSNNNIVNGGYDNDTQNVMTVPASSLVYYVLSKKKSLPSPHTGPLPVLMPSSMGLLNTGSSSLSTVSTPIVPMQPQPQPHTRPSELDTGYFPHSQSNVANLALMPQPSLLNEENSTNMGVLPMLQLPLQSQVQQYPNFNTNVDGSSARGVGVNTTNNSGFTPIYTITTASGL